MATQVATVYPHISTDPEICSGRPCVAGTRVRVMDVIALHEQGLSPEEIVEEFTTLKDTTDVYAALVYYADHKDELEADYAEGMRLLAEAERRRLELLESQKP